MLHFAVDIVEVFAQVTQAMWRIGALGAGIVSRAEAVHSLLVVLKQANLIAAEFTQRAGVVGVRVDLLMICPHVLIQMMLPRRYEVTEAARIVNVDITVLF